jgi:hypothetical protein
MRPRALVLGVALLATLAASWWAVLVEDEATTSLLPQAPRPAPSGRASGPSAEEDSGAAGVDALRVRREAWPAWAAGILQPMSFTAPAPPPAPLAVSEPSAPPLPFRYVGAIEEGGERAVILTEDDAVHIVRARERIGERYRIERISATAIEFTYLPLMQRQRLGTSRHEQYQ